MSMLRRQRIDAALTDPLALREALEDAAVVRALGNIGVVVPKPFELHAPSASSPRADGLGETLCGIRGRRHAQITCKRCIKKQGASNKS